jgi:hypothetical protein
MTQHGFNKRITGAYFRTVPVSTLNYRVCLYGVPNGTSAQKGFQCHEMVVVESNRVNELRTLKDTEKVVLTASKLSECKRMKQYRG